MGQGRVGVQAIRSLCMTDIEKKTGTSYVYARLVLGTSSRIPCSAPINPSVPDLRAADIDVAHGAAVGQGVLAGSNTRQVPGHRLVIQVPGDGGRRRAFGCAHQRKRFARNHNSLAEGGNYAGCTICGGVVGKRAVLIYPTVDYESDFVRYFVKICILAHLLRVLSRSLGQSGPFVWQNIGKLQSVFFVQLK